MNIGKTKTKEMQYENTGIEEREKEEKWQDTVIIVLYLFYLSLFLLHLLLEEQPILYIIIVYITILYLL